ncbi:hypothetical protein [Thalassobellus suaedae]|uniref:Uncharacterized protein n=1 Tax=Thalassobellus suaedae TaxID=3074124 RepID=A0ABY9XVG2_9FLAO|nr:hypothetical protein RHP51_04340 [Flavobacteriaceae bacterium HL-DH14]
MNYIKEVKAVLIFLGIFLLFFAFIYMLSFGENKTYFYYSIIGYLIVCFATVIVQQIFKNKIVNKITSIILFPAGILLTIGTFVIPFMTVFVHLFYYFILSFGLPILVIQGLKQFECLNFLTDSTIFFTQVSISVFISVLFNHQLRQLVYLISPARIKTSKKLKPYELDKLTDYLISEKNIRFFIYTLYFISLIAINIAEFQNLSLTENSIFDRAILQSFIVFIAFDRVLTLLKELEFKPSSFLIKIVQSISNKFKGFDNNNS